jgi:hypothetical protein
VRRDDRVMKIFFGLVGFVCMILGMGSCAMRATGGLVDAVAGATIGTGLFAVGLVALGIAAILEELQGLRRTLTEGLRHFAKKEEHPPG